MNDQAAAPEVEELRGWLAEHWDLDRTLGEWWADLADSGWSFPTWPAGLGGRGATSAVAAAAARELQRVGAVGPPQSPGPVMAAPTLLAHGTLAQQQRFLPLVASGAEEWCQLFSEPEAGSDLAGLRTRADPDGGGWRVNGQKVWSSRATTSDRGFLLARTDVDRPKHSGISWFVIDLDQPGVEIRPLRQMNGQTGFCEVFLDDAWVDEDRLVGPLHGGWRVAQTTLAHERGGAGEAGGSVMFRPGRRSGFLERRLGDLLAEAASLPKPGGRFTIGTRLMWEIARQKGVTDDPVIRNELMELYTRTEIHKWTSMRARASLAQGRSAGAESSIGKLGLARIARTSRDLSLRILGADGLLMGDDGPGGGRVQSVALTSPSISIAGGTDEINRNVIAERVLGLPKEPSTDRDLPFRDVPASRGTAAAARPR